MNYVVTYVATKERKEFVGNLIWENSTADIDTIFAYVLKEYNPKLIMIICDYKSKLTWQRDVGITHYENSKNPQHKS